MNSNDDGASAQAVQLQFNATLKQEAVIALYQACNWSAADKPNRLMVALNNSEFVVSAWHGDRLIGLGNAISDGALVVYFPHLLVTPEFQGQGVGLAIMVRLRERYAGFHQQVLLAVDAATGFYERAGFRRAGGVTPLWVYEPGDIPQP